MCCLALTCLTMLAERQSFIGEWVVTGFYDNKGDKFDAVKFGLPPDTIPKMIVAWDTVTFVFDAPKPRRVKWSWTIDPTRAPKWFDLHQYDPAQGNQTIPGIYEWTGKGVLKTRMCSSHGSLDGKPPPRPTTFTPKEDDRAFTVEYTRQPKRK
jgi:uncharacterized protein (TIGR03067 family)